MPEFLPFAGIRYDAARLAQSTGQPAGIGAVAAPPYDVIDEKERAVLEATDPHNAVHLILPRDARGRDGYRVSADALASWEAEGVLTADPEPRFYLYAMDFEDEDGRARQTRGIIGALGLPAAPGTGTVMPHERTSPKAKSDRLALLKATRANLDPIWCLSLAPGLTDLLEPESGAPLAECVDSEGVRHRLQALDGDAARIAAAVGAAPLMIADGHHRFETACAYRDQRADAGEDDPGASRIMAFVVELSEEELCVRAIHRLLRGVSGIDLRETLAPLFEVVGTGFNTPGGVDLLRARMASTGGLGLVERGRLALLTPRADAVASALAAVEPQLRAVDATVFEAAIRPRLPAATQVAYRSDAQWVGELVEKEDAEAALLLRPVTVPQIRAAAFAGVRMPQKTTFFHPKPRTGMVFRRLDR